MPRSLEDTITNMSLETKRRIVSGELKRFLKEEGLDLKFSKVNHLEFNNRVVEVIKINKLTTLKEKPPTPVPEVDISNGVVHHMYKPVLIKYLSQWGSFMSTNPSATSYYILSLYCYKKSTKENL